MATIFDAAERNDLLRRLKSLSPSSQPRWGQMTAHQAICHLSAALQSGLDAPSTSETTAASGPLTHLPLKWLVIHVLPWPKAKLSAPPELLHRPQSSWDADILTLSSLLLRAAERGPSARWPGTPVFGTLSGNSWGVLLRKHIDHHLRQFGA